MFSAVRLTPKLLILFGIPTLLAFVIVGGVVTQQASDRFSTEITDSTQELSEAGAEAISQWLDTHTAFVSALAQSEALSSDEPDRISEFLARQGEHMSDEYEVLIFVDTEGTATYHHGGEQTDLSGRDYWQNLVEEQQETQAISDPVHSASTGNPITVIAEAVTDERGEVVGLVAVTVTLDTLADVVATATDRTGALPWALGADGLTVAHPDEDVRMEQNALESGDEDYRAIAQRMVDGERGVGTFTDADGTAYTASFAPVSGLSGWSLGIAVPESELMAAARDLRQNLLVIFGAAVLVLGGIIVLVARRIARPIAATSRALGEIASGDADLTQRLEVQTRDEVGELASNFNAFVDRMQELIGSVSDASTQLSASAEELSASVRETSGQLREQQSETEQVATSMNEMAATIQQVAENASDASEAARRSDQAAHSGADVVQENANEIRQVAEQAETAAGVVQQLNQDAERVTKVLDVIHEITEQTNLLALNAAIEAARAGENGRGFSVVAEEVRKLATRTQSSTEEIREILDTLRGRIEDAAQAMENGRSSSNQAVTIAARASESLGAITDSVSTITDMNTQIASAAEEQSAASEEINRSLNQIKATIDATASGASQVASASEEVARLAADLQDRVGQFRVR
ncbi:methyl-accepting chemotaxis protein [Halorhodospira halophila]|uniref:Methyl-accepting chemotaxis sensory transducer n=1 Tax=Halorhodospira halophila (strain DSM 244 / SL1) TaxID=349124 RepID=A1WUH3_HALHL|nr:methyl-accepting chemotaxis protein [Halorhodospira halophila]ABM61335.1 methyl-accepting chemotaxis sensory transducer [Halorhodospira halophila SL1]MBK1729082.1 methyl-accepting chemotaxis protein [Halorhodospira halophila]